MAWVGFRAVQAPVKANAFSCRGIALFRQQNQAFELAKHAQHGGGVGCNQNMRQRIAQTPGSAKQEPRTKKEHPLNSYGFLVARR